MSWLFDAEPAIAVDDGPTTRVDASHSEYEEAPRPRASLPTLILCLLAVVAALYFTRDIVIPVVLALLLSLLLMPFARKLQSYRLPDLAAAFIVIAVVVALFCLAVFMLAGQAQQWLADMPETISKAGQLVPAESGPLMHIRQATSAMHDITWTDPGQQPLQVEVTSQDLMLGALGVSTHFIGSAVIVFVLAFFLLAFNKPLRSQAVESRDSFNEKKSVVQLLRNIENGVSRYLFTVTVINCGLGVATALLLWVLQIPNPLLWGVLVATLNFVPHVGAFVCMAVLFLVGAVSHESIMYGLVTAGSFAVLTSLESYFVTPMVLSRSLQLSPLAIILSILFWGWLWGIAGALMAAPLLAILKITCDQFHSLRRMATFLAGETANGAKV